MYFYEDTGPFNNKLSITFCKWTCGLKIEIVNCGRFWGFPLFAAAAAM